jgi:hypothetical protein
MEFILSTVKPFDTIFTFSYVESKNTSPEGPLGLHPDYLIN